MSKASIDGKNNNIQLWVKEAFKQDQGRGIIRIDPDVFKSFKFRNGDILQIYHPINMKFSAGILFPSKSEDKGTNIIRMDSFIMRNLRANSGDKVEFRKIEPVLAEQILFATSELEIVSNYTHILAKKFQNRVISVGNLLSFYYYGRRIDLEVVDYIPQAEVAKIHEHTEYVVKKNTNNTFTV